MSMCAPGLEWKAMVCPSGDQRAVPVRGAPMEVNCTAFAPSGSASQISHLPERVDWNATLRPSGENCGFHSHWLEEMAEAGGEDAAAPGAVTAIRQIFTLIKWRT